MAAGRSSSSNDRSGRPVPQPVFSDGLGFRVGRLARALRRGWAQDLAPLSLSPPQAAVLRGVAEGPGCSLRALARTLGADPMNVKRCIDELEGRGLIRSGEDVADRRRRTLTVTSAGESLASQVHTLATQQQVELHGILSAAQLEALEDAFAVLEVALVAPDDERR